MSIESRIEQEIGKRESAFLQELYDASEQYGFDFLEADTHYQRRRLQYEEFMRGIHADCPEDFTYAMQCLVRFDAMRDAMDDTRLTYYDEGIRLD